MADAVTLNDNLFVTTAPLANISSTEIGAGSYTTVEVATVMIEPILTKTVTSILIPISPNLQLRKGGSSTPQNLTIDLLKIKELVNVTGILEDQSSTSGFTKKANIMTIFKRGGNFSIVWGTGDTQEKYSVNVEKFSVKIRPPAFVDSGSLPSTTPIKGYDIIANFIIGTDRGG